MKKITLALSVVFIILTFIGAGYVLCNNGEKNAGYAGIPMIFALTCLGIYRSERN